ncbi:hypothetical protein H0H81_005149 [Sphagnurus paluster]|uniref:Homeobox domain-containing protein n=1 Tax=Sphagnurus paluster TaxID=117069 RepID=A0A9P7GSZ5_9AGAR|nr:hypothetical protein H0H81_005149 [Sphagnurus paluster]
MDPSSPDFRADFRAFFPYTPNEVKHRKRTTTTQLRTLEAVFKRDTKPNAPLRTELAAQLGMSPRGVQVFGSRIGIRAKEKGKASKATKASSAECQEQSEDSPESAEHPSEPTVTEADHSPLVVDVTLESQEPSSSHASSPVGASPPNLHVITEPSPAPWTEPPVDLHSLYVDPNLHAYRRGSLPVNAFPASQFSSNSPPQHDSFDPFARRLSVDASLQRLASNPYAHLARAKNGAIYGPRAIAPIRHRALGRAQYAPPSRASTASMPYRLDARRASMGNFRYSPQSTASPSPSPLSSYDIRASLPEHDLYVVSARTLSSPIPGPLPSPNFSFGAASTPSMVSSSGDSERNSPDSVQSYAYRESEQDEDEGTPASYYSLSRFGSITSIATSDSSINSVYYPEGVGCYEHEQDLGGRRDSCASGHFTSLMSGLDVNGAQEPIGSPQVYALHGDGNTGVVSIPNGRSAETSAYPSPASTISPGPGPGGSPHSQVTPPSVPISRSSELNHALHSQSDQVQTSNADEHTFPGHGVPAKTVPHPNVHQTVEPQYFYTHDALQAPALQVGAADDSAKYHYDYNPPCAYLTESLTYAPLEPESGIGLHHQAFEHSNMAYDAMATTAQHVDHQYIAYA